MKKGIRLLAAIDALPDAPEGTCSNCGASSSEDAPQLLDELASDFVVDAVLNGVYHITDRENGFSSWICGACLRGTRR